MPPNRFESEVESFLEGSHGDRTHIKRADHHTVTPLCGTLLHSHAIPPVQESTQAQKPQSINDPITGSEIQSGELHATLIADQVEGPGRASSRRASHTSATRRHWCGGRRRVRRARAGFEIDHSERSSRVAISRAAGASGARNSRGATNNKLNREFRLRRRRGRRAGGQATRRPEIWRGHKHQ